MATIADGWRLEVNACVGSAASVAVGGSSTTRACLVRLAQTINPVITTPPAASIIRVFFIFVPFALPTAPVAALQWTMRNTGTKGIREIGRIWGGSWPCGTRPARCEWACRRDDGMECRRALYFMHYNFCRVQQKLRVNPAMEAGIADHVWSLEEIIRLLD
jgi:hypothetical protein